MKSREEGDEKFKAEIGAEAVRTLLTMLDSPERRINDRNSDGKGLGRLAKWLRIEIATETSQHRKKKKLKRPESRRTHSEIQVPRRMRGIVPSGWLWT